MGDIKEALGEILRTDPQRVIALAEKLSGRGLGEKTCWVDFEFCPYDNCRDGLLQANIRTCRRCSRMTQVAQAQIEELGIEPEEEETFAAALRSKVEEGLSVPIAQYLRERVAEKSDEIPVNLEAALEVIISALELEEDEIDIVLTDKLDAAIDELEQGGISASSVPPDKPSGPPQPFAELQAALDKEKEEGRAATETENDPPF